MISRLGCKLELSEQFGFKTEPSKVFNFINKIKNFDNLSSVEKLYQGMLPDLASTVTQKLINISILETPALASSLMMNEQVEISPTPPSPISFLLNIIIIIKTKK